MYVIFVDGMKERGSREAKEVREWEWYYGVWLSMKRMERDWNGGFF